MSEAQLPSPINGGEMYLAAILAELRTLNENLSGVRFPHPPEGEEVELREPKATARPRAKRK